MSKRLLEDMVRVNKIPKEVKKIGKIPEVEERLEENGKEIKKDRIKSKSRYMLWFVALISIFFCIFAFSFLFSRAEISVNPKTKDLILDEKLSASKNPVNDGLFFDQVIISGEENKIIQMTGEKDVAIKATGMVIIYNTYSSSAQTLAIGTRLEGSNGKIYKTKTKVIVPGQSSTGAPGSIEIKIEGNEAGEEYNSTPLDFKISGFKGTLKYTKFYGRSNGNITGGFKGKMPDITEIEKTTIINGLKNVLEEKLLKKATNQTPKGFVLFEDAIFLRSDEMNTPFVIKDNNVTVTFKGTLYGLLFNEQKLTDKIAKDSIDKYNGSDVFISNIKDLAFTLANKDSISLADVKEINFALSGSAKFVWKLDVNKFTLDLLGKMKKDFNQVLSLYKNIDSATLKVSPFWRNSIPEDVKNINVIVNYPK